MIFRNAHRNGWQTLDLYNMLSINGDETMTWFQRKKKNGKDRVQVESAPDQATLAASVPSTVANALDVDIAPDDPLLAYILSSPGIIQVDRLNLESPALEELKETQVRLAVPVISQGELIGLLNLGSRLSEAD